MIERCFGFSFTSFTRFTSFLFSHKVPRYLSERHKNYNQNSFTAHWVLFRRRFFENHVGRLSKQWLAQLQFNVGPTILKIVNELLIHGSQLLQTVVLRVRPRSNLRERDWCDFQHCLWARLQGKTSRGLLFWMPGSELSHLKWFHIGCKSVLARSTSEERRGLPRTRGSS